MVRRSTWWAALPLLGFAGCDGVGPYDVDAPGAPAPLLVETTDPVGGLWPAPGLIDPARPDLIGLTARRSEATIEIELRFHEPVSADLASPEAFGGFVDLDVDQDSETGGEATVDIFRPDGTPATGLGVEYYVRIELGGRAFLFDVAADVETARLDLVIEGARATIRIPRSSLGGDDGRLNLAAVVGNRIDATDRIPDAGHLRLE
jgi:hypothetical protein